MQQLQESAHAQDHDYRTGSPHLKHWHIYQRLLGELRDVLRSLKKQGLPWSVLDIGAGHGSFTEPLLAYGCKVTGSEMSRDSLEVLRRHYGSNQLFSAVLDDDNSLLSSLGGEKFGLALFASVLHHIPDYEQALDIASSRLLPGGALVAFQDPLWYPTMNRAHRLLSQLAYFSWRLGRGNYVTGLKTRMRRLQATYDDRNPSDMVEYHVVRSGVNQERVMEVLSERFREVKLLRYWSTQSSMWQRVGEAVGGENTFGIVATNRRP